jgi:Nif-specific regulatory protein
MSLDAAKIITTISNTLAMGDGSSPNLNEVMKSTASELLGTRSFLLLIKPEGGRLSPVASFGLGFSEFRRLETNADIQLFRNVMESGDAAFIHQVSREASLGFLSTDNERALIAVPVKFGKKILGILAMEFAYRTNISPAEKIKILTLIGSLIAQNVRVEQILASERQKLIDENSHLRQELKERYEFSHIIGNSNPMKHVYDQVTQVARSNATVLLRGESGTGKEMIANAIHYNSLRSKRAFVKVNCAALPDTLIESELFGHEKGAFTGADRAKKGRFEMADGGTLFLDEIGDLPLQTQIKLLRVLQEREFERLGGTGTIKSNIRLITATNKNLEEAIAQGTFREDLYYRLNVFTIFLPPLRQRKSDILLLAEHFLEKFEREHGKRIRRISTPAIDMLMAYHFPGNVRELENAIERAVLVCDANVIHGHHLPPTLQTAENSGTVTDMSLKTAVEAFERDMIQDALKSSRGNVAKAAKQLDSSERIIGYKIKKYEIDTMRFRDVGN